MAVRMLSTDETEISSCINTAHHTHRAAKWKTEATREAVIWHVTQRQTKLEAVLYTGHVCLPHHPSLFSRAKSAPDQASTRYTCSFAWITPKQTQRYLHTLDVAHRFLKLFIVKYNCIRRVNVSASRYVCVSLPGFTNPTSQARVLQIDIIKKHIHVAYRQNQKHIYHWPYWPRNFFFKSCILWSMRVCAGGVLPALLSA